MRRALALALLVGGTCFADGAVTLRLAAVAPDGTAYARELRAFGRDVEQLSNGAVHVKWYFGAVMKPSVESTRRCASGPMKVLPLLITWTLPYASAMSVSWS